jgi:hypothetical protein
MEDQVAWWQRFQNDTRQRCASDECLLQIDLENAFGSISRPSFFEFVRSVVPRRQPVELLELLLDSLADGQKGLPLVNDSVFFLGNAYFSVVDHVVAEHTRDFIRFVDDYRIFGRSRAELESLAEKIGVSLRRLGFKINTGKLKVGTGAEYLEAISRLRYVDTTQKTRHEPFDKDDSGYTDPAVLGDVIPPEKMVELIAKTLENPEQYMHQGFGRFQIAALRRLRFDGLVASRRKADFSQRDIFSRLLSQREDLIRRAIELLSTYAERNDQLWRTLWLLYLAKDISSEGLPKASPVVREFDELRDRIRRANSVPTVARLWAAPMPDFPALPSKKKEALEMLHQAGYLERGMQCYGDPNA